MFVVVALGLLWVGGARPSGDARGYAKAQAAELGWTGSEWLALDAIVVPESHWNPCARYPHRSECGYAGSNSCGIPQASPCPQAWRGSLGATWRAQVDWLLAYIKRRYGTPARALSFRRGNGWY